MGAAVVDALIAFCLDVRNANRPLGVVGRDARGERLGQGLDLGALLEVGGGVPAREGVAGAGRLRHRGVPDGLVGLAGHVLDRGAAVLDEHDGGGIRYELDSNGCAAGSVIQCPVLAASVQLELRNLAAVDFTNRLIGFIRFNLDVIAFRYVDIKRDICAIQVGIGIGNPKVVARMLNLKIIRASAICVFRCAYGITDGNEFAVHLKLNGNCIAFEDNLLPLGEELVLAISQRVLVTRLIFIARAVILGVPAGELVSVARELVCPDINLLFGLADGRKHGAFATIFVVEQTVGVLLIVDIDDVFAILLDRDGVIGLAVVIGVVLEGAHHIIGIDTRSHRAHRGIRTHDCLSVHINMIDRQICKVLCVNLTVEMPRRTLCNIVVCAGLHMKLRPRCVINNERLVRPIADDTLHGLIKSP